jgi:acetyl esterase/lipase
MKWVLPLALLLGFAPGVQADRFSDWDKNKDGKLQKSELPPNLRRNFERVDTNNDGVISREEDAAFVDRRRAQRRQPADHAGYRQLKNLDYVGKGNMRQTLDLFLPEGKSERPRPLLVFIHGGAWRAGSKEGGFDRLLPYLEAGDYAGASINYRLTNEARWPAQIHDCKAAIRWLKAHAGKYGYDAGKIGVWGTSAGGHLVAMLGVSGDVPELKGELGGHLEESSSVNCVVNYFGPSNLLTMDNFPSRIDHGAEDSPEGRLIGGALAANKDRADNASPVSYVSKGDAPMLLAHGSDDKLVPHNQSVDLAGRLKKAGVPTIFITMEGAGHGFRSAELSRRVTAFLGHYLRGKESEVSSEAIPIGK